MCGGEPFDLDKLTMLTVDCLSRGVFGVDVCVRGASAMDAIWSDCSDCPRALKNGRWMLWLRREGSV